ncbi:5-methylcytosine-specific restriction enzyme A [Frankineae bacterium MT45]|nr:5-methylcytosine-specific restriction enzyme A [Frankineae bacterium MT45]
MPLGPPRLCNKCRKPVRGACPTCSPADRRVVDQRRGTASARGYNSNWHRVIRRQFLRQHPLCALCGKLAMVPDHWPLTRRQLIEQGVPNPDAFERLRPLCTDCHNRHGAR